MGRCIHKNGFVFLQHECAWGVTHWSWVNRQSEGFSAQCTQGSESATWLTFSDPTSLSNQRWHQFHEFLVLISMPHIFGLSGDIIPPSADLACLQQKEAKSSVSPTVHFLCFGWCPVRCQMSCLQYSFNQCCHCECLWSLGRKVLHRSRQKQYVLAVNSSGPEVVMGWILFYGFDGWSLA